MPDFTLGIEEEFQIVDPVTRELRSHITEMLDEGRMIRGEQVKPEMHQSMIEAGTGICANIQEARTDVIILRRTVAGLAQSKGLRIIAASTHPFSHWKDQKITPHEHYYALIDEMQVLAESLLIFGMHVHVGIADREAQIHLMNAARYFLPHLLALSTSSPFWMGTKTGLKSYRSEIFKKFPRTDIPDYFGSYSEFDNYVTLLLKTGCIDKPKKIWWDVRPHPHFPTLEFRICDIPSRVDEVLALAALIQAIVAKLAKLYRMNMGFRLYRGEQIEVPVRDLILELLECVEDVVDELGSRKELEYRHKIEEGGTSADRQLKTYEETGSLNAVVDQLIVETMEGID